MSAKAGTIERRRRLALRWALIMLAVGVAGWPAGVVAEAVTRTLRLGDPDAAGGFCFLVAIAGLVAAPWIVVAWRGWVERQVFDDLAARRPDLRRIACTADRAGTLLAADNPDQAAEGDRGGSEAPAQLLVGRIGSVPFTFAAFAAWGAALASFRLPRPRPGLTIVARDRGILGNLVARAGLQVGRVGLEDPTFERLFEAYGTDQVAARRVLTTTMLERMRDLDATGAARGYTAAMCDGHLLLAFRGLRWRPPAWLILRPAAGWLPAYERRLDAMLDLPAAIVQALELTPPEPPAATAKASPVSIGALVGVYLEGFAASRMELLGGLGIALIYVASGLLFGGLAAVFARLGLAHPESWMGGWQTALMVVMGLLYGAYAVCLGLWSIYRLLRHEATPLALRGAPGAVQRPVIDY